MAELITICSGMPELITICSGIFSVPIINECIVTPLKNHISYAFTLDTKLQRLRKQVEDLKNKRQEMQHSVREAGRNGEQIYEKVDTWLSSAEKYIQEADQLLQGEEEAKKKCCVGFCPNLKTRYHLSKIAHKNALVIDEQLKNEKDLYPISFRPALQPIVELSSGEALQSRREILNEIVDALKDPNLNPIVVHGMGGIGKTTLAKEVLGQAVELKLFDLGQAVELKLFDDVVFVAVSEMPDLRRIQREIADGLGLKFKAEEAPERAKELHNRLNNNTKKVLIIFDDVWQELNLYDIGILSTDDSEVCKILLTSRKKNVLCSEMRTKKEFPLGLLKKEEAWKLFEKIVTMEFLANSPEFHDLSKKVVDKCGGLPLLIQKVATDLRNNKRLHAWKDMLIQLEDVEGTEIEDKVHKVIESSYQNLKDDKAKSLFLLCPLFGISNIPIRDLLIYCMGLGLFKRDSIEDSRNRMLTLIDKLKNESLLLDGDKAGFVKIHDVVRDIAAAIASNEHCAFVGKGRIESTDLKRKGFRRISFPYCGIPALPEGLQCPEAEVFSVFSEYQRLDMSDSFFEGVKKLKVLHLTSVRFEPGSPSSHDSGDSGLVDSFSVLPSSLRFLTGLQTLSLDRCRGLKNVTIVARLTQLKILSFAGSDVQELPKEIKVFAQLKLLDLTDCNLLDVIPSNVLSNLHLLEELYVFSSFVRWGTKGNASLVELKNLSHLKTLEIEVRDEKLLPEDWFFNGIQNFKISIGDRFGFYGMETSRRQLKLQLKTSIPMMHRIKEFLGEEAEVLYLKEMNGIENLSCDSRREKNSFQRLRVLEIENYNSLREVLPFSKCLPHLQKMEVDSCSNMEAIVGEGNEDGVMELTQLTSLKLKELPHLIGICRTTRGMVSFPNLTSLEIDGCYRLKYVFTTSMVKSLKQLKRLVISRCDVMKEIILVTECEEVVVFPQLKELRISWCASLKKFVGKDSDRSNNNEYLFNELVTLPNLEIMEIQSLGDFRYLWHQQFADKQSFSKLKSLEIRYCGKLSIVFPSNSYRQFERLESLYVSICNAVKEIYEYEGVGYEQTNVLQAFSLQRVCLKSLQSLKHIWSKGIDEAFSFQNLQSVRVRGCPELKYVIPASIACGLQQLQKLKIENCGVEMIIAEPKNEGSEGVGMPTFEWPKLESLKIRYCNKLIRFGFIISKDKHNIATPDSVYFIQKVIPNVKVLKLDRHSLKAITQSDDKGFSVEPLQKLKEVTLVNLEEESVPILLDFLRGIYSVEKLTFQHTCLGERLPLLDSRAVGDQEQQFHLRVKHLHLERVSKLKHIVEEDYQLNHILQSLRTLSVSRCNDMMNIAPTSSSSSSSSSVSFMNLTTLHVYECDKMTSLVTASTAKRMTQLSELKVYNCKMMEDIIVADDDGGCTDDDNAITFNVLKQLTLDGLPTLNSFCAGNYNINFPLLEEFVWKSCNQMKTFCGGEVSTPKLQWTHYMEGIYRGKEILMPK